MGEPDAIWEERMTVFVRLATVGPTSRADRPSGPWSLAKGSEASGRWRAAAVIVVAERRTV